MRKTKRKSNSDFITWQGQSWRIKAWARAFAPLLGLKPSTVEDRLVNGWDIETALTTPKQEPNLISWQGESKTLRDWAKQVAPLLGLQYRSVEDRVHSGWDIERAFTVPRKARGKTKLDRFVQFGGHGKALTEKEKN